MAASKMCLKFTSSFMWLCYTRHLKIQFTLGQVPERDQELKVRNLMLLQSRGMTDIFYS